MELRSSGHLSLDRFQAFTRLVLTRVRDGRIVEVFPQLPVTSKVDQDRPLFAVFIDDELDELDPPVLQLVC